MKKILITAALPYANGPLHFGHMAGAYLPADCYARYQRLKGSDVLFISGSDEHGVAITLSAESAGRSPKEHVDLFHEELKKSFASMKISFDHYSRTTWKGHRRPTVDFFLQLQKNGYIEEIVTHQLYSEKEQRFLADRYVQGTCPKCRSKDARGDECLSCGASFEATDLIEPRSKLTGSSLTLKPTKHWFLRFDQFKEKLKEWIETKNWKPNVINFVQNYIDDLKPRAITRDSTWGIPLPLEGTEGKVFYVWFDAPIGYISASMEWALKRGTPEEWKKFWQDPETKLVNFIGKDNIPFHAIFFPAMVMGQDEPYKLVDELPANEFYNLEGKQFSKSSGWFIDLESFFHRFSADQIRYTIAANAPETQDSEFTWKDFQARSNSELLGKYGNLVNRVLVFTKQKCGGVMPLVGELSEFDQHFLTDVRRIADEISTAYEQFQLRKASQLIMELAQRGNVYFDHQKPWKASQSERDTTIACCLQALLTLALISFPIIPDASEKLWALLGNKTPLEKESWNEILEKQIPPNAPFPNPTELLFKRVEDGEIEEQIAMLPKEKPQPQMPLLSYEEFKKVEMRVAQILSARPIPKSKKLYQLELDLGVEKRTVVSALRVRYPDPDLLVGKKVACVTNLRPTTLMGVESHGMVLVTEAPNSLHLIELPDAPVGSVIA